jgi:hypothetical protein
MRDESAKTTPELFDDGLYSAAEAAARDFLEVEYAAYRRRVAQTEDLPENRQGADKSWVHRARRAWKEHRAQPTRRL